MRARRRTTLLATCAVMAACGAGCGADEATHPLGAQGTGAPGDIAGADAADDAAEDVAAQPVDTSPDTTDTAEPPPPDAATVDAAEPPGALARIYENNPKDGALVEVELPYLKSHSGFLTGPFVRVSNCTQSPGGKQINYQGTMITLCKQEQTATLGDDGTYLHIDPPGKDTDGNDAFAELMMYWHVNKIHDYFHDVHGLTNLDFPLDALVNVQFSVFGGWLPFDNAAFIPKESLQASGLPLDLNGDSIVFGQGTSVDFAYEADVIYHEYTHAMIGTTRLTGVTADEFGPTNLPSGMNEGFADYFAATIADDPLMGSYALSSVSSVFSPAPPMDLSRDLSEFKRCPDDLTTEFHADGEIIGSAMWTLRTAIGPEAADAIILRAMQTFTNGTGMEGAGQAIIAEAAELDPPRDADVQGILLDHGIIGCDRVMDYAPFVADGSKLPIEVPGTATTGLFQFKKWVTGFVQWRYAMPAGKVAIDVNFKAAAGGAFGGGGGAAPSLALLVKKGGDAIRYTYQGTSVTHDADVEVPLKASPPDQQGLVTYTATIFGDCVTEGEYVLHVKNQSPIGASIYSMVLTGLAAPPEQDPTFSECAP